MKKTKLYYADIPNMGDQLNPLIFDKVFNISVKGTRRLNANVVAIGSSLGRFLYSGDNLISETAKIAANILSPKIHVWGTGFMYDIDCSNAKFFRKMSFHAVRGKLSLEKTKKITGQELPHVKCGDGGILADGLIELPQKKYSLGIIPHFKEQSHALFSEMHENYTNSKIIDLKDDPISVIQEIASCEHILSSSLHGLIVADSFHIPNKYIKVTSNMLGDGFKYKDYYSNFDLPGEPVVIESPADFPSIDEIVADYAISKNDVEKMKNDMIQSFPYHEAND